MRRLARPLLYLGTAASVLSFGWWHARFVGFYELTGSSPRALWSVAYVGLLCLTAYGVGLPDLRRDTRSALVNGLVATGAAAVAVSVVQLVLGSLLLPRFVVFASALVLVPWYALCSALASDGRHRDEGRDRVLAVVGLDEAASLEAELERSAERPASLVGVLEPEAARPAGGRRPVLEEARATDANVVILDRVAAADDSIVEQAAELHESGSVRIRTLTLFYDEWLAKLPMSELERVSLMFDIGELHRARYGRVKRLVDIAAAGAGLVALGLVLPAVVVGNWLGNRGGVFFRQVRVGRNGRQISIVKLRTMIPGSDSHEWTIEDDPRITPFGRWLRRTHIDELPQAWNLLRGDLSLVGPRPEQPRYVHELSQKLPFYRLRHLVRPGVTGWAQVKYAYGSTEFDALEKLQYEFWYLRHQRMGLDLRIAARTIRHVISRSGR